MILGPVVGALAVIAVYMVLDITRFSFLISGTFKWTYPMENVITYWQSFQSRSANWNLTIPAFIVHLWLPLFAMSVLAARALNSLRLAARFAQWFLKDGKKAPFRSLGIIAALIVFVSVLAWRVVRG